MKYSHNFKIKISNYLNWRQSERFWRPSLYVLNCVQMTGDCDDILGGLCPGCHGHWVTGVWSQGVRRRDGHDRVRSVSRVVPVPASLALPWLTEPELCRRLERGLAELAPVTEAPTLPNFLGLPSLPANILTPTLTLIICQKILEFALFFTSHSVYLVLMKQRSHQKNSLRKFSDI